MKLILGSGSPRRLELLGVLGVQPDAILPPDIDEDPKPGELPRPYVERVAREKALAVTADPDDIVLCADTTVAMGRRIMGKPADAGEAAEFLTALSGRRHRVYTSVAVRRGERLWERTVESRVQMKRLSDDELNAYLASDDWRGKAGGYATQAKVDAYAQQIIGSYSNVVGLPLHETARLLTGHGFPVWKTP